MLTVGSPAPDFTAHDADGNPVQLSSLFGRFVLVYFYPKDDTPGCTTESCTLNDLLPTYEESGASVIGVSMQDAASHQKFRAKYSLRFPLVADTDGAVADAYGVAKRVGGMVQRVSFLVGPDGNIAHVWEHVTPAAHAAEVLETVRLLSA